jgi:hypothetical protein
MSKIRTLATDATSIARRAQKKSAKTPTRQTVDELCDALELLAMAIKDIDKRLDKIGLN